MCRLGRWRFAPARADTCQAPPKRAAPAVPDHARLSCSCFSLEKLCLCADAVEARGLRCRQSQIFSCSQPNQDSPLPKITSLSYINHNARTQRKPHHQPKGPATRRNLGSLPLLGEFGLKSGQIAPASAYPNHLDHPLNFLTGGKAGQAGVSDHFSFSCLRLRLPLFQSCTTKTKSTISPMAATINRPPPKQNGSTNRSMIFATYHIPIPGGSINSTDHRKKRMPIYQKVK